MPRKCSAANCRSNYDTFHCEVTVYGFPKDIEERQLWINALPNKIEVCEMTKIYLYLKLYPIPYYPIPIQIYLYLKVKSLMSKSTDSLAYLKFAEYETKSG